MNPDDHMFLRLERKGEKETAHKFETIAKGPFRMEDV